MAKQIFPSAVRTANLVGDDSTSAPRANAITAVIDVTAVPGAQTVQLVIEGKDPASGKYWTLLQSTARSTTGTEVLQVGPGLPVTANVSANAAVPQDYRIRVVHSGGGSFTYSVSAADN